MTTGSDQNAIATLRAYAEGRLTTRRAIEALGLRDYADLVIALARNGLDLPRPSDTPRHAAQIARAGAILQPLLRSGQSSPGRNKPD
jgi:hypothetical protein